MPNNVKLLLVDDNPMVLNLLRGALAPLAAVTTASDGADALLKAVDDPPHVVVSDYRMPGMDGRQLIEKLKSRPSTAGVAAILLASKADITEKLGTVQDVDDYLEKPFFLKEATQRIRRVIDKIAFEQMAKAAPSDGVLVPTFDRLNLTVTVSPGSTALLPGAQPSAVSVAVPGAMIGVGTSRPL